MSLFKTRIPIRFGDCDSAGIGFYPRYFEMINNAVEDWFEELGYSFKRLHLEDHTSVPTVRFEVDFTQASRLGDMLEFSLMVDRLGQSSCRMRIQAHCHGELRMDVRQTIVFVDMATMSPAPWPDELRARMEPYTLMGAEGRDVG
jgi:4-hydroxybenzoyl-CoA thioesterase